MNIKQIACTAAVPATMLCTLWLGGWNFERHPLIGIMFLATVVWSVIVWLFPWEGKK